MRAVRLCEFASLTEACACRRVVVMGTFPSEADHMSAVMRELFWRDAWEGEVPVDRRVWMVGRSPSMEARTSCSPGGNGAGVHACGMRVRKKLLFFLFVFLSKFI